MRPFLTVLPEKYSERNLMSSMMGVINDYVPLTSGRHSSLDEQVLWSRFEDCDMNNTTISSRLMFPLVLSIGTCENFYFWGLTFDGKANLLFSERNSSTIDSKLLPTPTVKNGAYDDKRPIMALCDSIGRNCCQWQVRFVSLIDYKPIQTLYFESKALSVDANSRFVAVTRTDSITILDANSFLECFTIACVRPTVWSNGSPKNIPHSMGVRWFAFADAKPVYHHLSRCGDASSDESQPLSSTVLNVNKRIWNSLSALASTVVSGSAAGTNQPSFQHDHMRSSPRLSGSTQSSTIPESNWAMTAGDSSGAGSPSNTPGYVTVVDLVALHKQFGAWRKLEAATATVTLSTGTTLHADSTAAPQVSSSGGGTTMLSGTAYLNVHDHCEAGSVVAHFMAHRWANVAMIKFDPTGSLLFTACTRGHTFNLFRISSHPWDQRQTAVHHLYILERGTMPCEVVDASFSYDTRWLAVSTNHGTTHVFPITAYGGPITVRTHTRPYVVNRTSRYHRSSGLEEHHLTRPQRERSSSDLTLGQLASTGPSSDSGQLIKGVLKPGNMCCGAPMAGLSPQCPHLGVSTHLTLRNPAVCVDAGPGEGVGAICDTPVYATDPPTLPAALDGACACPLNARYNQSNPRLPPYPEPCHIKPEARLRPHMASSTTTGAAVAALGAATGALEAVSSSTSNRPQPSLLLFSSKHSGPCMHYPTRVKSSQTFQVPSRHQQSYCHPLPIVDHHVDSFAGVVSGPLMAARFAPAICFSPNRPRQSSSVADQKCDPYGSKARPVDGLFILTADLHLVEYDLCVGPAETSQYGEKLYQEASIRLDCTPVGEWNLQTDAICVPPFSKQHPILVATANLINTSRSRAPSARTADAGDSSNLTARSELPSSEDITQVSESSGPSIPAPSTKTDDDPESSAVAPAGWSPEDAASYWYSQVEITTHLGPLRRVWMGPQFTFRPYSSLLDSAGSSLNESSPCSVIDLTSVMDSINSAELYKFLPPCNQPASMVSYYGSPSQFDSEAVEFSCTSASGQPTLSSGQSFSGATMLLPESGVSGSASPGRPLPKSGTLHSVPSRLLEGVARLRNSSGESTHPLSIPRPLGSADASVVIEGGSYQDSSLGGSLSSLLGRFSDDVASCIADAIQDEEACWRGERDPHDSSSAVTPVGSSMLSPFTVRSIPIAVPTGSYSPTSRPESITMQSALSEDDFPSQNVSPHEASTIPWCEQTGEVIGDPLSVPDFPPDHANPISHPATSEGADPAASSDHTLTVEAPKRTKKKSKRSKKSRSGISKSSLTSSAGELTREIPSDNEAWKQPVTSLTSPSISGPQSLSSSPAVGSALHRVMADRLRPAVSDTGQSSPEPPIVTCHPKSNLQSRSSSHASLELRTNDRTESHSAGPPE
ncbi:hypothetical protein CRM22_009771 [Opisthorchis felineus]|uniref:BCAS3 WD40 domain-containing protein n=1 Tax=Opisthorchis felineus TaxID=147828 RepID=A0A4S2L5V1_OPIFE|nr:hypothetical protein CRM22_009771 [Opisthorchis felineus]TGZ58070.1 hypothetical protein CRM22_009771 [Opisthorchis felineus]